VPIHWSLVTASWYAFVTKGPRSPACDATKNVHAFASKEEDVWLNHTCESVHHIKVHWCVRVSTLPRVNNSNGPKLRLCPSSGRPGVIRDSSYIARQSLAHVGLIRTRPHRCHIESIVCWHANFQHFELLPLCMGIQAPSSVNNVGRQCEQTRTS
jgi:hypothetical protein